MIKRILVSFFVVIIIFLAFYKPKGINLDGNWKTKKIVLDGKKIYPDTLAKFFHFAPEILIKGMTKSISIPIGSNNIIAKLYYIEKINGIYKMRLSSNEKSLNGNFDMLVDTLDIKPQSYRVEVKLIANKTLIQFQKHIFLKPWKPEFPRRGQV